MSLIISSWPSAPKEGERMALSDYLIWEAEQMEAGRIDCAPDYKSNGVQANFVRVTGPISCVRCSYTTRRHHDAGISYEEQQRIFDQHLFEDHPGWQHQTPRQAERARLERAIVERAREFTDNRVSRKHWDALVAYRELCRVVDALLEFEAKQDQK